MVVRIPTRNGSHFILLALKKEIRSASSEVRGRESHLLYHRCSGEMRRGPPLDRGPLPPHLQHQFFRLFQKEKGIGGGRADMRLSPTVGGSPDISLSFSPRERECLERAGSRYKAARGRSQRNSSDASPTKENLMHRERTSLTFPGREDSCSTPAQHSFSSPHGTQETYESCAVGEKEWEEVRLQQ